MKSLYLTIASTLLSTFLWAQCDIGQVETSLNLYTDAWGYELYWEIVPSGNACGDGTILSGGNPDQVGCTGGGEQDATGGNGYGSNITIQIDAFCLEEGVMYDFVFVDDWGDGGMSIEMIENGLFSHFWQGSGSGNVWTFEAGNSGLPIYDSPCGAETIEIDGPSVFMNNVDAIGGFNEIAPPGGNCGLLGFWCENAVTNSVWAQFVAPESGSLVISTCNEGTVFDTQFALYSGSDCMNMSEFTLVASNDDAYCGVGNYFGSTMYASCLTPGETYFIQIDGWNGDVGDVELTVNTYTEDPSLNAQVNSIACALNKGEQGNGSIYPYVVGVGVDFESSWAGPNGFTSTDNIITNLNEGEYTVMVTNECGLELTATFTISQPNQIFLTFEVGYPACPQSTDGEISVNVTGGVPDYELAWEGPDGFGSDSYFLEGLLPGEYSLNLNDANGCEVDQTINLTSSNEFTFDLGPDTLICVDDQVVVYGPVGSTYDWNTGSENQFVIVDGSELGPGTFSFILTAMNDEGCEHTDAMLVTIDVCSGVEVEGLESIKVWPVPAEERLFIQSNVSGPSLVQIVDLTGRVVLSQQVNFIQDQPIELEVSEFATGQYFLTLSNATQKKTMKVVLR
jgi:hypothetical protein